MTTQFPKIALVFNRYKTASSLHKGTIEVRISYNNKQKYMSTGISVYPKQWKRDKVINAPDAPLLNQILDKLIMDIRQVLITMAQEECIDIFAIPSRLKANKASQDFFGFMRKRADVRRYNKAADTQKRYLRFIEKFKNWGGIARFEDITEANVIAFDRYLSSKEMKDYSKWQNYHRFLNSFINDAINEGILRRNPYKWLNIEKGYTDSLTKYLTSYEFHKIKTAELPTESLSKVRDVFVFQVYTCLSYSDLKNFDCTKIQKVKGMMAYIGKRGKTGKNFTIPLLPPALKILKKYNNKLPIISNVKYNLYLKAVAQNAGVDKPLTTHWARHTGATLLLNEGVDMRIVSKICGHSSTRITEKVYAKLLDETVVDALKDKKDL